MMIKAPSNPAMGGEGIASLLQFKTIGRVGTMSKLGILAEFWEFLRHRKKYWLAPIIIMLLLLSALIILSEGSALAPFVYTLF